MVQGKVDRFGRHTDNYPIEMKYHQTAHEFEAGGHKYQCLPLNPFEQIHMMRKLAPIALAALKPDDGRKAILARLMKLSSLAQTNGAGTPTDPEAIIRDAMDLATSVFSAAAETDEEMLNAVIKKCMGKILRVRTDMEGAPAVLIWDDKINLPTKRDIDGFQILELVGRYLFFEFREHIAEFFGSLNLKPGPALMAAAGMAQRPPGAPGAP